MDWTIALSVVSFVLALISVLTVILTIRQNNRMIEESTRPVLAIYTTQINPGSPDLYFVVRNFGHTPAVITSFNADCDFKMLCKGFRYLSEEEKAKREPINNMRGAIFAPGQSRIALLNFENCPQNVSFQLSYKSTVGKEYKESLCVDLKAGTGTIISKHTGDTVEKNISNISYTLQEMLQKQL